MQCGRIQRQKTIANVSLWKWVESVLAGRGEGRLSIISRCIWSCASSAPSCPHSWAAAAEESAFTAFLAFPLAFFLDTIAQNNNLAPSSVLSRKVKVTAAGKSIECVIPQMWNVLVWVVVRVGGMNWCVAVVARWVHLFIRWRILLYDDIFPWAHPILSLTFINRTHSSVTRNVKRIVGLRTKRSARSMHEEVVKSGQLSCKEGGNMSVHFRIVIQE